jgi:cytoskeletal protein CcmA (bactofilin family)
MFGSGSKAAHPAGTAHTLVSRQTEIVGDVRFAGELIVEGRIRGNVFADDESGAILRLADGGVIEGEVWVPVAVINGLVEGDLHCSHQLELAAKGVVMGNVFYNLIEMVMGSEINGSLLHIGRAQQEAKRLGSNTLAFEATASGQSIVD